MPVLRPIPKDKAILCHETPRHARSRAAVKHAKEEDTVVEEGAYVDHSDYRGQQRHHDDAELAQRKRKRAFELWF